MSISAPSPTTTASTSASEIDFEAAVKLAAERAVLKFIGDPTTWLMPNYEGRLKVPPAWMAECWRLVDTAKVQSEVARLIEAELGQRIFNAMATELGTDIKQILSVQERREMIRAIAREYLDVILAAGASSSTPD